MLSIIIVNYNNPILIDACLKAIDEFLVDVSKEVIVVDNNSTIENLAIHKSKYYFMKIIYLPENMGFGYANNVGVKNSSGDNLLLLNSDTEFVDNSLLNVLNEFNLVSTPEVWGLRLVWPNGDFQSSYSKEIGFFEYLAHYTCFHRFLSRFEKVKGHKYFDKEFNAATEVDVVYGTAMLMRRVDYEKLGGFSKKYFMYFEDVDFCDRFKKELGGKIIYHPQTTLIHRVKGSSNRGVFNIQFIKSQYIYGIGKFGYFLVWISLPFDTIARWLLRWIK